MYVNKSKKGKFCCQADEKLREWTDPNYCPLSTFHPTGYCSVCGVLESYIYHVPEALWRNILPKDLWNEVVCAGCFHYFALFNKKGRLKK